MARASRFSLYLVYRLPRGRRKNMDALVIWHRSLSKLVGNYLLCWAFFSFIFSINLGLLFFLLIGRYTNYSILKQKNHGWTTFIRDRVRFYSSFDCRFIRYSISSISTWRSTEFIIHCQSLRRFSPTQMLLQNLSLFCIISSRRIEECSAVW